MLGSIERSLNLVGLLAITAVLIVALGDQILFGELPCPLCILQRVGFTLVGAGLMLNLVCGIRSSHYGIMLLGAAVGGAIALRQIALHVVPGSGSYGDAIFGYHYYSWAFFLFGLVVIGVAVMLFFDRQFGKAAGQRSRLADIAVAAFAVVALANGGSTLLECGGGFCPDDPQTYQLLEGVGSGDQGASDRQL